MMALEVERKVWSKVNTGRKKGRKEGRRKEDTKRPDQTHLAKGEVNIINS